MDVAAQMVDKEIEEFERKLKREYEKAQKDIERKCKKYLQKYQKKDKLMQEKVKLKEVSQEDYITWRWNQLAQGKRYQNLVKSIENQLVQTNVVAANMVNDATPRVYAENINYAMYDVEKGIKAQTSFSLYNTTTVRNSIIKGDMYIPKASVDIPKDRLWNRKKVQSVFTQSIIKGESIPKIAKNLQQVTDANRAQATRTARTCMTAVQNDARIDGYMQARELGIDVKKGWLATLDNRTRQSHRHIDGEIVELEEEFSNGCQYPGDPRGKPEEIYNCRCTLVPKIGNEKMLPMSMRANNLPGGISYEDWKGLKAVSDVVNGRDISATWKRRADKFDFEIEDVINAQGFDGKPKVVSKAEFDEAVKNSNFIAQRAYSAPDQETLDAYRDQLYDGKWYVDCSTGGARHGQGMYCIADYNGNITGDMRSEASAYARYYGKRPSYIETFTVDPSAKFIEEATIREKMNAYNEGLRSSAYRDAIAETMRPESVTSMIDKYKKYFGVTMNPDDMAAYMKGMQLKNMKSEDFTSSIKKQTNHIIKKYKLKDHSLVQSAYMNTDAYKNASSKGFYDIGSFAAAEGFDGIKVSGREGQAPYAVILNRTKVIFLMGG